MAEVEWFSTSVREMPAEERPRERLARLGPEALKDAELIAILFRSGSRKEGAVALAERVVKSFKDLRGLARASLEEIQAIHGIGQVKAIELKAAMELGKRLSQLHRWEQPKIKCPKDLYQLLITDSKEYETERFRAVLLNTKNQVLKVVEVSHGSADGTMAAPRDVFRQAVREGATNVMVAHNHPSGDPEPSRADIELTQRLVEAGRLIGITVLDHIVMGDGRYVSFAERQML